MKTQKIMFTRSVPKMSNARLFRSVLALAVVALIMHVSLPRAQAYDLSSLNGSYADSFSGFFPMSPNGPPRPVPIGAYGPFYSAGLWTFDGAGGLTVRLVFNFGGGLIVGDNWDLTFPGTYTVNSDGTGTTTFAGIRRRHFVIGAGGNELKYIGTDPTGGNVIGGSMVKQ
jgi:hypothetical protein